MLNALFAGFVQWSVRVNGSTRFHHFYAACMLAFCLTLNFYSLLFFTLVGLDIHANPLQDKMWIAPAILLAVCVVAYARPKQNARGARIPISKADLGLWKTSISYALASLGLMSCAIFFVYRAHS